MKIQQYASSTRTAVEYCKGLTHARADSRMHELIEQRLHAALELQFHLGQLLAEPELLDDYAADTAPSPHGVPLADDPWCLTDPRTREHWQIDPRARQAIAQLWRYDPDPALTKALAAQVSAALKAGQLVFGKASSGRPLGNYFCCPWSAIYEVRSPLRLLGRRLQPGQQFAMDVSAEEIAEGGQFVRRIVIGPFSPTNKIDYCDPSSGHDD